MHINPLSPIPIDASRIDTAGLRLFGQTFTRQHGICFLPESERLRAEGLLTTKGDFLTYSTTPVRKGIGTDGYLIVADSTQTEGWKWAPGPSSAGIIVGLDKDRPAASGESFYQTTDSLILYSSDRSSKWLVAGSGPDKVAYGTFSDSNFLQLAFSGATNGPIMSNPYTICIGFNIVSLPGASTQVLLSNIATAFTDGWYIATSTANPNKLKVAMRGINSSADNEFSGMTALTTGAHSVAVSYDGSNLVLVCDGGSAQTIATTGSYTVPAANAQTRIGRYANAGSSFSAGVISYIYGYDSALSTADKQTLTTTPSNYRPGSVTPVPAWVFTANAPTTGNQIRTWGSAIHTDGTCNLAAQGSLHIYTF